VNNYSANIIYVISYNVYYVKLSKQVKSSINIGNQELGLYAYLN